MKRLHWGRTEGSLSVVMEKIKKYKHQLGHKLYVHGVRHSSADSLGWVTGIRTNT